MVPTIQDWFAHVVSDKTDNISRSAVGGVLQVALSSTQPVTYDVRGTLPWLKNWAFVRFWVGDSCKNLGSVGGHCGAVGGMVVDGVLRGVIQVVNW